MGFPCSNAVKKRRFYQELAPFVRRLSLMKRLHGGELCAGEISALEKTTTYQGFASS